MLIPTRPASLTSSQVIALLHAYRETAIAIVEGAWGFWHWPEKVSRKTVTSLRQSAYVEEAIFVPAGKKEGQFYYHWRITDRGKEAYAALVQLHPESRWTRPAKEDLPVTSDQDDAEDVDDGPKETPE